MAGTDRKPLWRPRVSDQGFPQSHGRSWQPTIDRLGSTAAAAAALALAVLAVVTALGGVVDAGVDADYVEGVVRDVDPAGIAWRAGVRPGQPLLSVRAADEPGGWAIETRRGSEIVRVETGPQAELLRSSAPLAVAALVVALGAVTQLPRRRRLAEAGATLSVVVAGMPIAVGGDPVASRIALGLAVILPTAWLARWLGITWKARIGVLAASVATVGVWLLARAHGSSAFGEIEQLRLVLSVGATLAMLAALVGWHELKPAMLTRPRLVDAASFAAIVGLATLLLAVGVPGLIVAAGAVVAVALYPAFRRTTLRALDRAFLAEQRERHALAASEAERARLARELHDAPLQDLAGVIQRLEELPGSEAERQALRDVAEQLRGVTTELHPPVLDDLGLLPAIEFLIERTRTDQGTSIRVEVDDQTRLSRSARPPAEVELAVFRVVQEALGNAMRHASASEIVVSGLVSPRRVELSIADDGIGIGAVEPALRKGRLGLASMHRRAESIGATMKIGRRRGRSGSEVRVRWEAEA
jgi:signal transduction histidine kinase